MSEHHRVATISGAATTRFGRLEGLSALDLMAQAAEAALDDARIARRNIDGVICGYATTLPHLMLCTLFCEGFGLSPSFATGMQLGGATGAAMLMLARDLIAAGRCRNVLVVAGENRLTGQSRDRSLQTLAQVGHAEYEVPNGPTVPAYYALLASRYLHEFDARPADLAEFAVLMRRNASRRDDAHLRDPITVQDVMASKVIAAPLRMLDCCPISDGAAALIVTGDAAKTGVAITGCGQAHQHQHVTAIADLADLGARAAATRALTEARLDRDAIDYLAIYDSFTITLALLLEELGFAPRGASAHRVRRGDFHQDGPLPLNLHGGLLAFGHCGVAGGLAHAVEAYRQVRGTATVQARNCVNHALLHADGGVMSSHVTLVLSALR